jgi:hypothetical protein
MTQAKSVSKLDEVKFEVEMFEVELLDLKGKLRDKAMKSYRKLVKVQDKPIYLTRSDE